MSKDLTSQSRTPQTLAAASGASFTSNSVMEVRYLIEMVLRSNGYACDTGGGMGSADVWAKKDGRPEIYINMRERSLVDQPLPERLERAGS